jgi:hypothetical protein
MIIRKFNSKNVSIIAIVTILLISYTSWRYHKMNYQMAILETATDWDSPDFPSKKVYFDASKWLKQKQYIKIDDYRLLNLNYEKFDLLYETEMESGWSFISSAFLQAIEDAGGDIGKELNELKKLNSLQLKKILSPILKWQYLYTEFDKATLLPTLDYFLFEFDYKGKIYELLLIRTIYEDEFIFLNFFGLKYKGWAERDLPDNFLTYRKYLEKNHLSTLPVD